ncbi:putative pre-mrna-splicing factor cwc26 [Erysiphe necator]|uniref:Putative pre-mrna-splicing factor cwc26 n=1 Tax=Uncinula necator TaxID=52586 RepID=A0A0B1PB78_UNCNE|nr:putative pre-mrna-splicing factor cwc26 [Erysiphe necator]
MSLSSYLASKYLTVEPKISSGKKRKRNEKNSTANGLIIADDDILGWSKEHSSLRSHDVDKPLIVNQKSLEIQKVKKNTWKKVGAVLTNSNPDDQDADEAEKIIALTTAEKLATQNDNDQKPILVEEKITKMENGTHAGLQSAKEVAKQFEQRKQEEAASWKAEERSKKSSKKEETIYRDATGRRIDLVIRRQEAQREAALKAAKEREKLEELKGDVQRAEKIKLREELDDAKFMPLSRSINDEEMNKELREKDRWNDPAAKFMSQGMKAKNSKPLYVGAAAPNRYKIRPGYRWDGVDRGNGWEAKRFNALNTAARNKELSYSWQTDE